MRIAKLLKWISAQMLKESGGVNGIENGTIVNSLIDLEKLYPDDFVACDGRFVTDEKLAKKYGILNRPAIKLINSFTPNARKWINHGQSIYLGNPSNGNITKDGWVVFVDINYGADPAMFRVSCLKFDDDGTITQGAGYPSSYRNFVKVDYSSENTSWFLNESVLYFITLDVIYTYTIGIDGSAVERGTFDIRTFFDSPLPYGYRVYAYIVDKKNVAFIAISSSDGYNANNDLNNSIGAFYTTDNGLTLTKGSIDNLSEEFSVGGFVSFANFSRTVPFNEPFCNLIQMDKNGNLFVVVDYVPSSDRPTNPVVFKSYDSGKTWRVFYKKLLGANVTINRGGSFFGIVNDVLHIGVLFSSSLSSSYGFIDHVDSETGLITEAVSKIDRSLGRSQNRNIAPVIYKYDNVYYISKNINDNYIWDFDNPSKLGVLIPIPNDIYPSGSAVSYNGRLTMELANPKFIRSTLFMDMEQTVQVDGLNMTGTIVDLSNSESVAATGEFSRDTGTNGYLYYSNTGHKFYTLNAVSNVIAVNVMEFGYKLPNKPNHYLKIEKYDV